MKITIAQEHLSRLLSRVGRIISAKVQLPVLQNVLLVAENGRLSVTATNLETTITTANGIKMTDGGSVCVPAKLLSELVATLPPEPVNMEAKEEGLHIVCGGVAATIPVLSGAEFPPVVSSQGKKGTQLDRDVFMQAVGKVVFSAATDEGRPLLTGVKIRQGDDETVFAATDGYRLSVARVPLSIKGGMDLVIPARALSEVMRISAEEKEEKTVTLIHADESQAGFVIGDTEVFTRIIDGDYPNFEKIIPKSSTSSVEFDVPSLVKAVKSAAVFARDNANIIRLHLENQGSVTISAQTPQVGENRVDVPVAVHGDGGDIAFNSRFLLDLLGNYKGERLSFEMTGALNPGVFRNPDDAGYLHIIMPVRLQG